MTDRRQQAINELQRQMQLARERLGADGIKALENLMHAQNNRARSSVAVTEKPALAPGMVPYDRASAARTLELFFSNHKDPDGFEQRLRALLKKSAH